MIMIGVSTGQNITNAIPAVQKTLNINKFIAIETEIASRNKWSEGFLSVLLKRNIKSEILTIGKENDDIVAIFSFLKEKFMDLEDPIIWNIGGGQKTQQIPIWELFKERCNTGRTNDMVCYTNQNDKGFLDMYEIINGNLCSRKEIIDVDFNIQEIFEIFGYEVDFNKAEIFYEKNKRIKIETIQDFYSIGEFRKYLSLLNETASVNYSMSYSKEELSRIIKNKKEKLTQILESSFKSISDKDKAISGIYKILFGNKDRFGKLIELLYEEQIPLKFEFKNKKLREFITAVYGDEVKEIPNNFINKLNPRSNKISFYFERILTQKIYSLLNSTEHNIIYAYSNIEIFQNKKIVAEYDIACVTNRGTIIALDAKTFTVSKKDIDARLYNLEKGSGYYRDFYAVIPYSISDINEDWNKLNSTFPFDLSQKGIKFFILNETNQSISIKRNKNKIDVSDKKNNNDGWIFCKNVVEFIK